MTVRSKKKNETAVQEAGVAATDVEIRERTAERAHELFLKRGRIHGHDLEDWLQAEREIREELQAQTKPAARDSEVKSLRSSSKRTSSTGL
jgi:hypothetical protein